MGDISLFNNNYMATMQRYADLESTIKELTETKDKVRAEIQRAMEDYNIRSIENDILKITLVAPSVSTTIDTKALRMRDPDTYEDLLDEYPKTIERKQSLRITIR